MLGKPKKRKPKPPEKIRFPASVLFRMFVLGSIAVIASIWALWRYYNVPRMPMLVPAPSATEIEIEP
jgi:hypothetical protein